MALETKSKLSSQCQPNTPNSRKFRSRLTPKISHNHNSFLQSTSNWTPGISKTNLDPELLRYYPPLPFVTQITISLGQGQDGQFTLKTLFSEATLLDLAKQLHRQFQLHNRGALEQCFKVELLYCRAKPCQTRS